ncbi:MAG: glycosyltransferase family 61 protein [Alphaproteobacteria bacterium]|nr:glycosyltransferase family 61 protein [Alphaproteobacteria bacterium]
MSLKIYASKSYKKYFEKQTRGQHIVSGLEIVDVPRGIIAVDSRDHGFGVFDENGKFVKQSLQIRKKQGQFIPKLSKEIPFVDQDVLYFGNVYPSFGHFLLEHMNRGWGLLRDEYKHCKVVLVNNKQLDKVPGYMFDLITILGVRREDIIVLNQTTQFRRVVVPQQAFNIPIMSSLEFGETFSAMAANAHGPSYEKVYLSRDKLEMRRTYGEAKIQSIFEKNGFKIIYPETLPLEQQIAAVKNCRVLAGCAGTAMHLALFMPRGGMVIQLKRNSIDACNAATQYMINNTLDLKSVFVSPSIEEVPTSHFTNAPQIIGVNQYMKQFFDDFEFKYTDADIASDTNAIAEYRAAMDLYKKTGGSVRANKIKHAFIKYSACLIPGRERRGRYRAYMKSRFVAK